MNRAVRTDHGGHATVRRYCDGNDRAAVAVMRFKFLPDRRIPAANGVIETSRRQDFAVA